MEFVPTLIGAYVIVPQADRTWSVLNEEDRSVVSDSHESEAEAVAFARQYDEMDRT